PRDEASTRAGGSSASSAPLQTAASRARCGPPSGSNRPSLVSTLVRREMADSKGNNRPKRPVRPRQAPGGRKRRVVIEPGSAAGRQDSRQARDRAEARPKSPPGPQPTGPVTVTSGVTVKDLSPAAALAAARH